jgi:CRISPR system Cascade subunit CasA
MDHDLLADPLLTWRDRARRKGKTTLPGVLAKLASGELSDFSRLRAHQLHPWCMFLAQLAAIALRRAGLSDARVGEDEWRQLLLALTGGAHEPWALVVEDLAKAAFFQPPVPEGTLDGWKTSEHPDDIDILVTAKAHDVKPSLIASGELEAWAYALVTLQTMQGYPGRGYTRIARMKGGYGNRARVGYSPSLELGARFIRDVQVLLGAWESLASSGFRDDGTSLVWTVPWDGRGSLARDALSPHFIEVCWRVRLCGRIRVRCLYTTTSDRRCLSEVEDGDLGDPWIPIEREGGALTVGRRGFDYRLLVRLLAEDEFAAPAAQQLLPGDDESMLLLASALARGQGKTEGLHERSLPVRGRARWRLGSLPERQALARRATDWVVIAEKLRSKVLYPALRRIALGDHVPDDRFNQRVDEQFFDRLFGSLEQTDDEARPAFETWLEVVAWQELQEAIDRCSLADAQRLRAISVAEGLFKACLHKHFPDLASAGPADKEEQS